MSAYIYTVSLDHACPLLLLHVVTTAMLGRTFQLSLDTTSDGTPEILQHVHLHAYETYIPA